MPGPKMLTDANRKLAFVPILANYHLPLLTELNAVGTLELSCLITLDGYGLGATGDDEIDEPSFCSSSNAKAPGRTNYEAMMNAYRWKNAIDDKAWTTFIRKGLYGYLVERIGQINDGEKAQEIPFRVGDVVRVFEVLSGTPQVLAPTKASYEKFKLPFNVQDNVDERAVVAGALVNATATATTTTNTVTGVTVTNGGSGYLTPPTVVFSGPGTGAAGTANISGGAVLSVTITAPGTGYTTAPTVSFTR